MNKVLFESLNQMIFSVCGSICPEPVFLLLVWTADWICHSDVCAHQWNITSSLFSQISFFFDHVTERGMCFRHQLVKWHLWPLNLERFIRASPCAHTIKREPHDQRNPKMCLSPVKMSERFKRLYTPSTPSSPLCISLFVHGSMAFSLQGSLTQERQRKLEHCYLIWILH